MPPRCWGVKGRGRGKFPADIWCIDDLFKGRFCPVPRGPLAHWSLLRVGWKQAGPHASGRDEPGQIGRSSPKSWFRVPWQARPTLRFAQRGPGEPSLGLRPRESALAWAPRRGPIPQAPLEPAPSPGGRPHGKPGPFAPLAQKGRARQPFARRLRLALTGRHWHVLPVGARSTEPAGLCSATHLVAHAASPALFAPRAKRAGRAIRSHCVLALRFSISESAQPIWSPPDTRCTADTPHTCCAAASRGSHRGCRGG